MYECLLNCHRLSLQNEEWKESEYILSNTWGSLVCDVLPENGLKISCDTMWGSLIKQHVNIIIPHLDFLTSKYIIKYLFSSNK